jgi:hypothetical protein
VTRRPRNRPEPEEIERFVRSVPEATFFHTAAWLESLAASFPSFDVFWLAEREGGELAGAMPVARVARGPFYHLQSLPFGAYGDPLARSEAAREALFERFFALARSPRCLTAGVHCFGGRSPAAVPRGASVRMEECRLVRLDGGIEEVWRRTSGKRRQLARRAERAGLVVRLLEREDEVRRLHAIYAGQSRAWGGVHPYPKRLFLELWRRRSAGVVVVGAFLDGELLGGHVDLFYGGMAQAWQGGMTPEGNEHEAGSLCARAAMEIACDRGMRVFNLGSSAGERGIVFFKESLGGEERRYPVVTARGAAGRLLDWRRRR